MSSIVFKALVFHFLLKKSNNKKNEETDLIVILIYYSKKANSGWFWASSIIGPLTANPSARLLPRIESK